MDKKIRAVLIILSVFSAIVTAVATSWAQKNGGSVMDHLNLFVIGWLCFFMVIWFLLLRKTDLPSRRIAKITGGLSTITWSVVFVTNLLTSGVTNIIPYLIFIVVVPIGAYLIAASRLSEDLLNRIDSDRRRKGQIRGRTKDNINLNIENRTNPKGNKQ